MNFDSRKPLALQARTMTDQFPGAMKMANLADFDHARLCGLTSQVLSNGAAMAKALTPAVKQAEQSMRDFGEAMKKTRAAANLDAFLRDPPWRQL
jgi:hypothetical protein